MALALADDFNTDRTSNRRRSIGITFGIVCTFQHRLQSPFECLQAECFGQPLSVLFDGSLHFITEGIFR